MERAASIVFLALSLVFATDICRGLVRRDEARIASALAWCVVFGSIFFGCFFALGFFELATGRHVVSPAYACAPLLLVYGAVLFWRKFQGRPIFNAHPRTAIRPWPRSIELRPMLRWVLLATVLMFLLIGLMLLPGYPRGYEPLAYHLPIAVNIFQAHSLKVWDTSYMHAYPANASLYYGFLLGLVSEHLVAAADLIFLVPLGLAIFAIGRMAGADVPSATLASLGLITVPIVSFSAFECGADIAGAAFLAIAILFVLRDSKLPASDLIVAGLAAGLAFGFKSLHLVSICFLSALLVILAWKDGAGNTVLARTWSGIRRSLVFLVPAAAASGFWLVRNYLQFHNPLYPVSLPFFKYLGWRPAPDIDFADRLSMQFEWVRSSKEWFVYPWLEWQKLAQNFKHSSGLGPFFAACIPVACCIALLALARRRTPHRRVLGVLLAGGFFVLGMWWLLGDRQPRYFLGALVFLFPVAAWMLSLTRGRSRQLAQAVACISVAYMLFVVLSMQAIEFGVRFIYGKEFTRHAFYKYPAEIDSLPPGSILMNVAGRELNYALFGQRHRSRVISYTASLSDMGLSALSSPEDAPPGGTLHSSLIQQMGVTHLFTMGSPDLKFEGCVVVRKLDEINPVAEPHEVTLARALYALTPCTEHAAMKR